MGFITISGDSDGDLHTADLHNKKFGAVASVLNGNIEHDNLKYPNSEFLLTAHANYNGDGWVRYPTLTSGVPAGTAATNTASHIHAPLGSVIRIPFAGTFTDNVTVSVVTQSAFSAGDNLAFLLQKSSSLNGTYSQIGSTTNNDCQSASSNFEVITITGTSGQSVAAGDYIRVIVQNAASNPTYPPSLNVTARMKTEHV
mgnify:FL=1